MACGHLFHLYLHLAVGRVHIVELLLARGSHVALYFSIKQLVQMEQLTLTTQIKPQVIESTIYIMGVGGIVGPLSKEIATNQP